MTLVILMKEIKGLTKGDIVELVTTFLPAQGIDTLHHRP